MPAKTAMYFANPAIQTIRDNFPERRFSEYVSILILASPANTDPRTRELARKEAELFAEKYLAYTIHDQSGNTVHTGDLSECKKELTRLIEHNRDKYYYLHDYLGNVIEQGGNRDAL